MFLLRNGLLTGIKQQLARRVHTWGEKSTVAL